MTNSCVFCKIVSTALNASVSTAASTRPSGQSAQRLNASVSEEVKAEIVYRDEQATAFRDLHPVAPTHILIVPNKHIDSVGTLEPEDEQLVGHLFTVARKLAEEEGISRGGYRMITNTGANGGQTVFHLHVHLIGGQRMRYPMG